MAWGGGGRGVWVISEKKILQNDLERKKILEGKYLTKTKFLH